METPGTPPLLPLELLAMMARGVSVIVSSCGPDLTPSLMRAVGSQVGPQGEQVTVFLNRAQSAQLLRDVARTGRVAVVFSEPHSHRTVQLKSNSARLREVTPDDVPALQRYLLAMQGELGRIGFAPDFAAAMLAYRLDDLSAVTFAHEQAFDQTPGPRAGQPLGGPA
ncbi:hypothetical protein [Hydrogenophaga flava]|uniref:hypothetical protein n=1 Tax=Hydrogenophaga flava TaxID=65657 RepID=UPI001FE055A4|nr:hypothetical protein [Hydrogenophaga flava]